MSIRLNIDFLDVNANKYEELEVRSRTHGTNEELAELAGQEILDMIIQEYDKCDQQGYTMPDWLTGGVWGFVVGGTGNKEVVRFDWVGCVKLAEEEIKNRPPKIIVPDKNIFIPSSLK